VIASKVPPKNHIWPAFKGVPISEIFPSAHIEKCVDDSLRSLAVDSIDIMQFHVWQDGFVDNDDWKETIQKLTKVGKVRFWGISANDYQPSNCLRALDTGLISTVQFIFNIFHQKPTEKLFPYALKNNIGLIARVPLDEGGLTGKFTLETKFSKGDFRRDYFSAERLKELVRRTDELKKLLGKEASELIELDMKYILSWAEVSTVIPGMHKISYVDKNIAQSDGRKLSGELMEQIKKHVWERNFYSSLDPQLEKTSYVEL
jgi:aryl-alcohol dehydrogenase-like predicted oxidoreductase